MLTDHKQADIGWDYRDADTKELTHGIHPYPAMMVPQVARRLIDEFGVNAGALFDPYCGTGTTLLEGMLAGIRVIGTDLNPLARLIASVKTTPLELDALDREIDDFIAFGINANYPTTRIEIPEFANIDYWFDKSIQRELGSILGYVNGIASGEIADFFRVAMSLTVRRVSWTKNSEFKLVRVSPEQMERQSSSSFSTMIGILENNRNAIAGLNNALGETSTDRTIADFNSVVGVPSHLIGDSSVDLIVTSPPYGDSKTTVAYGQFSRLSSQWLGFERPSQIDNELMGGRRQYVPVKFGVDELDTAIASIADTDGKRANEVASFFVDYRQSIANVASVVKPGGYACYVVGNRTVKGVQVPTAETTAAFFERSGFSIVELISRNIPNKRMPYLNSPSNVPGKLGKTMNKEFVVVCRKSGRR